VRVCHLTSTGLEGHYFADLAHGLPARGVVLLCGSLTSPPRPAWLARSPSVDYFQLAANGRGTYPLAALRLSRLLRDHRIEILQTHLFDAGLVGLLAAKLARTPVTVLTRHHINEQWLFGTRVHVWLDRLMARVADHVVVPSNAVRELMISREQTNPRKPVVIHHGLALSDWRPGDDEIARFRAEFTLCDSFVLGSVGRFVAVKGQHILLMAAAALTRTIPNLKVLLVGEGDAVSLRRLSAQLGLDERVVVAGHRRDVAAAMAAMDVFVHPALTDAFGQVLIEAMAVGTPVVSTTVGGIPEIVESERTGLLVPPDDPAALTAAIDRLHADARLRRRLADRANQAISNYFSAERMLDQQVACYARWLQQ
jgi:glycosyltransferase involved in cell wall biosynthesis